ncbi:hypothetical protein VNO77_30920 [Canavalia gladiata]|uniref:Uncharacterized protein n=1 Tax=Canavalia gladiata TaxID=3824 RepID=A0AAN9KPX2_CANGL
MKLTLQCISVSIPGQISIILKLEYQWESYPPETVLMNIKPVSFHIWLDKMLLQPSKDTKQSTGSGTSLKDETVSSANRIRTVPIHFCLNALGNQFVAVILLRISSQHPCSIELKRPSLNTDLRSVDLKN